MTIEKKPFRKYNLKDNKVDIISVKFNEQERELLELVKKEIEQVKDSTALKQVFGIGAKVILNGWTGELLRTVFINKRRNKQTGIYDFE